MGAWTDLEQFKRRVIDSTPTFDSQELRAISDSVKTAPAERKNGMVEISVSKDLAERAAKLFEPNEIILMGWLVMMSRSVRAEGIHCHVSASLHPKGRSSTAHDMKVLALIVRRLGAPDAVTVVPSNGIVHHYVWQEVAS